MLLERLKVQSPIYCHPAEAGTLSVMSVSTGGAWLMQAVGLVG